MNVKISVIVPVYNASLYLSKCVDSLLNQSLEEIEVILIDDGSSDDSKDIIENYAKVDHRIIPVFQQNSGPSAARNRGIGIANGEFVAFVDADDWLDRDAYKAMYYAALQTNADIVFTDVLYEFNDSEKNFIKTFSLDSNQSVGKDSIRQMILPDFLKSGSYGSVCKLFNTEFLEENHISFDESRSLGEDWLFNMAAFTHSKVVYYINKPYYHYRQSEEPGLLKKYRPELYELYINQNPLEDYFKKWGLFTEDVAIELAKRKCFVAVNGCIQNEFKKDCKNNTLQKIKNISKVVNHPSVKDAVSLSLENEKKIHRKGYLTLIKQRNTIALFLMGKVLSLKS